MYINLVEHPARISCGVPLAVTEWRPSYKRGTLMQAPLALIGSLSALAVWGFEGGATWLIGGLLLLLVVPFTLVAILPDEQTVGEPRTGPAFKRSWPSLATMGLASCDSEHPERSGLLGIPGCSGSQALKVAHQSAAVFVIATAISSCPASLAASFAWKTLNALGALYGCNRKMNVQHNRSLGQLLNLASIGSAEKDSGGERRNHLQNYASVCAPSTLK
jgi:hypothetical protein